MGLLDITTRIGCSLDCVYCPQKLLASRYCELFGGGAICMSLSTFKTCVDKLPQDTSVFFGGMCEPWLNKDCTEMLLYAKNKGFSVRVFTTLVGMVPADFERIKDIDFEGFILHIPDAKNNSKFDITNDYLDLLRSVINYKKGENWLITQISCHSDMPHPAVIDIIDAAFENIPKGKMMDRAGNVKGVEFDIQPRYTRGKIFCSASRTLKHGELLPNGSVAFCYMDYGLKHIIGNLLTDSYEEIYSGEEFQKVLSGLTDEKLNTLCRTCDGAMNVTAISKLKGTFVDFFVEFKETLRNFLPTRIFGVLKKIRKSLVHPPKTGLRRRV